jgi:hypothetical protein
MGSFADLKMMKPAAGDYWLSIVADVDGSLIPPIVSELNMRISGDYGHHWRDRLIPIAGFGNYQSALNYMCALRDA